MVDYESNDILGAAYLAAEAGDDDRPTPDEIVPAPVVLRPCVSCGVRTPRMWCSTACYRADEGDDGEDDF